MSRITGTDAANLMEAYTAVYAPQEEVELTEEQVQEDFENWVNSLVEEGHDLSEYTWEDMYEAYIEEQGATNRRGQGGTSGAAQSQTLQNIGQRFQSFANRGGIAGAINRRLQSAVANPGQQGVGADRRQARGSQYTQPAPTNTTRPAPAATAPVSQRPAAPAATTPARPAATAPVSQRPAAPAATTPARPAAPAAPAAPARTFNPLMQRTFGYQTGNAPSQIAAASAGKPVPSGTALGSAANPQVRAALNLPAKPSLAAPAPRPVPVAAPATTLTAPKPPAKKQLTPTQMRQGISASFDPFDVVMGYLIDEGYAETEQAAAVIMANMSDEWRQSIVEAVVGGSAPQMPAPIAKFVDELPNMVQNVLKGRQSSSAKPSPKKSK